MNQKEILVKSSLDGTMQPSLFYNAKGNKRPLLVGLHTWSYDRFNQIKNMLPYAEKYDFNLLLPEFRGAYLVTNKDCVNNVIYGILDIAFGIFRTTSVDTIFVSYKVCSSKFREQ